MVFEKGRMQASSDKEQNAKLEKARVLSPSNYSANAVYPYSQRYFYAFCIEKRRREVFYLELAEYCFESSHFYHPDCKENRMW